MSPVLLRDAALLFLASFGAATVLPGSSEVLLLVMLRKGHSVGWLFTAATLGNYLGALVNYLIGRLAGSRLSDRLRGRKYEIASRWFARWGHFALVLSWVPVIGDPLTVLAGLSKMPLVRFSVWVLLGKAGRYAVVILLGRS